MAQHEDQENLPAGDGAPDPAALEIDLQKVIEERDTLQDRLLRKQAEFENYKKRVERERTEYVQFASAELMRELLNALDSFDLAIHNVGAQRAGNENLLTGLDLIYKQFQDTLARFGLKPIDAKGQTFDPNFHQAVSTIDTNEVEDNTVVDVLRRGYTLNGRLLRPAMVSVSRGGGN